MAADTPQAFGVEPWQIAEHEPHRDRHPCDASLFHDAELLLLRASMEMQEKGRCPKGWSHPMAERWGFKVLCLWVSLCDLGGQREGPGPAVVAVG